MDYREIWKAHYVRIMQQEAYNVSYNGSLGFFVKKKNIYPRLFSFMHFIRKDPQYRQYPGERITRLLIILQNCRGCFFVFWTV